MSSYLCKRDAKLRKKRKITTIKTIQKVRSFYNLYNRLLTCLIMLSSSIREINKHKCERHVRLSIRILLVLYNIVLFARNNYKVNSSSTS